MNAIEEMIETERKKKLLDVAKYVMAAMIGGGAYDGTLAEYAIDAVNYSKALIKEVESR